MALGKRVGITLGDASQGSSSNVKKTKQDSTSASASGGTGGAVAASAGGGAGRRGRVGERGGGSEGDGGAIVDHGPASTGERRPKKRRQGEDEAEDVELRLRVRGGEDEAEEIVRVRPDMMDLTAHTRLVGLPEELRACAGRIRSLAVRSEELEALPAWVGELTELMELRVDGMGWNCSLQELPDAVGQLTKLRTLELRGCPRVKALPQGLSSLTGLEDLLLMDCSGLKEVPEWVTALTGLRVLFEEWRLRVRSEEGKEEEVFARVRPDIVDLTAHTGLVALPEELRACAGRVRALAVRSEHLEALPAWVGELTGLTDLRVFAWDVIIEKKVHYCPLRELPKETGQLTRLQTLDLSACSGLEALPAELGALTGLRELNLSECSGLTALPAELGALTGLRELVLSGCSALTELPAELGALTGLQELVLSRCSGLTALRAGLGALTGLRKLLLSFCSGLTELPAKLGALTGLQRLGLDSCFRLTKLPAELGAITGLQRLSVRWCFGLTALPAELGTLTGLRELYLAFCSGLKELPAGLTTLTGLQELVLRGCYGLTELPAGLTTLTGLRELDLRGCYGLTELPAGLTALTGLRELDLDGLKEVPAWVTALTGLRVPFEEWRLRVRSEEGKEEEVFARVRLDIVDLTAHTGLVALPEELRSCAGRVRALAVRSEHLEALPAWLGELTGLTDLRVSGWWDDQKDEYCYCPLRELPKEMGQLTRLQTLDLGLCSGLTALPAGLTGALTGLRELHLSGCSALTALPAELGALTGLQELVLRGCYGLTALPSGLTTLTGLRKLVLIGCYGLTALPAGLTTLTGLRELDLSGCSALTALLAGLTALTGLRELDLDGLKEVPAWVTALTGLRVPFEEWRLRVRSEEGKVEEVFARVQPDKVDLTAHTGLVALPEELRSCAGRVRALAVRSEHLEALPAWLGELTGLTDLRVSGWWDDQKDEYCYCPLRELPKEMGQLTRLQTLDLGLCSGLTALPAGLTGALTGLRELHLTGCSALTALPAELGALTGLQELVLRACSALHTPPPRVVAAGTDAVLDFLRDLGDGSAPCHLVKLVLIGEQRAGKSSLADSLVRGNPATRPVDDRTVGIDVHRWWLGAGQGNVKEEYEDWEEDGEDREEEEEEEALLRDIAEEEELVAHIYDAAGHSVYHASHGAFMSAEALFLHVVRSDKSEEEAAAAVLEWVEAVQQEAPGAAMGVVWTHADLLVGDEERERLQRAVLARVKTEIERQVRAVDEAMRQAEGEFEADAAWREKQAQRDAELESLDDGLVAWQDNSRVLASGKVVEVEFHEEGTDRTEWLLGKISSVEKSSGNIQRFKVRFVNDYWDVSSSWSEEYTPADEGKEWRWPTVQQIDSVSVKKVADALARLATLHHEMQKLEARLSEASEQYARDEAKQRLQRLREQLVQRPRILFSNGVSSKTGYGLQELRKVLAALMKDQRLFPHVGRKVPLSYAMLERLAQEGRALAQSGSGPDAAPTRAAWEDIVTSHVNAKATKGLRALCAQPYVSLWDLEREAAEVGIDKDQVHRALQFLHATGSVLHYGSGTRQHSQKLQQVVFMQPQFIIDVIKYVIRESRGENVNDELRAMDDRIRGTTLGEDLDLLLDRGELKRSLLAELWAKFKFKPQDQRLMLELMKDFKLLRDLGNNGEDERYVVPAMLPTRNLPPEFLEPRWWHPSRANAAARIEEDGTHRPAAVRVMYQVLGGQLPFSFMGELQVSLAQSEEAGDADLQQHFAPERSVEVEEERVGGSVLCERRGNAKEWVVLSHHHGCRPAHAAGAGAAGGSGEERAPALRVMAWVELMDAQRPAATDWRLFRHVRGQIKDAAKKVPGLILREMACYVDHGGMLAKPFDLSRLRGRDQRCNQEYIAFDLDGGGHKDVKRSHVLPSEDASAVMQLVSSQGAHEGQEAAGGPAVDTSAYPTASQGRQAQGRQAQGRQAVIEGFFCQKNADKKQLQREIGAGEKHKFFNDCDIGELCKDHADEKNDFEQKAKHRTHGLSASDGAPSRAKVTNLKPACGDPGNIDPRFERHAFLIGNGEYPNPKDKLLQPERDARKMGEALQKHGFKTEVFENQKKREMKDRFCVWRGQLPATCVALLYCAGHGCEMDGENFFMPIDAPSSIGTKADAEDGCVSLAWMLNSILQRLTRESLVIVLLDCCRDNPIKARGMRSRGTRDGQGLAEVKLSNSKEARLFVGYAAGPGMHALEGEPAQQHGVFTQALLNALESDMAREDIRAKFFGAVIDFVGQTSQQRQRPEFRCNMDKGFVFK
jgi:Leucine-rich repeat (LRR) protein/uncharacterized caspase-like protein/GTPase SAR1 family protein